MKTPKRLWQKIALNKGKTGFLIISVVLATFFVGSNCLAATEYDPFVHAINPDVPWGTPASNSDASWGFFGDFILEAVSTVLFWVLSLVVKLVTLAVWFLEVMMTPELYQKTLTMEAVSTGWELVRDFLNMFFILIILFVAISTILRIEKYDAKKMLHRIILAALLINFSKPIALFFIDISQLAMGFFMNNISSQFASYGTTLMDSADLQKSFSASGGTQVEYIISMIFAIVFLFVFAVMIFVLALGLFLRLIAFLVLIVLSPFAFFGMTLPGTPLGSSWDNWLKKMTNWGFFGPVLLFFLWLALVIIDGVNKSGIVSSVVNSSGGAGLGEIMVKILTMFIPYVFAIYLLWYGYDTAGKMAKEAGESARRLWGKGEKWATDWNRRAAYGAAAVGTLGAAPAVYYGGRTLGRGVRDYARSEAGAIRRGMRKRFGFDDEKRKEREEEREARVAGGEALIRFRKKKANEQVRDWEDKGSPTRQEQARITSSGSDVERMALAIHRAKNGELRTMAGYEEAIRWAGNDQETAGKIRSLAEKKNLLSVLESDTNNADQLINTDEDENIDRAINNNASIRRLIAEENERLGVEMDADQSRQFIRRTRDTIGLRRSIYNNKIRGMSYTDMKDQDVRFFRDRNVIGAIENGIATSRNPQEKRQELRRYAYRNMSEAKIQALEEAGLLNPGNPEDSGNPTNTVTPGNNPGGNASGGRNFDENQQRRADGRTRRRWRPSSERSGGGQMSQEEYDAFEAAERRRRERN